MKTMLAACLISCALAASAASAPLQTTVTLVRNGGFENGATGWSLPRTFQIVSDVARSGKCSLRVDNQDPNAYLLAGQSLALKPGMQYRFQAWVKTRGVQGKDNGATLCIEWSGKKGWLGGAYPEGRKGNQDWTLVEGVTPPMPAEAASIRLSLYLRRGMTGTAWFDDVRVAEFYPPPLDGALLRPNYRGRLRAESADQSVLVRAKVGQFLSGGLTASQTRLLCAIEQNGKTFVSKKVRPAASPCTDLTLDARALPPGDYRIRLELAGPDGAVLGRKEFDLAKLPAGAPAPKVYLDEHNRTIVDGKPFFPLGWYFGPGPTDKDFARHLDRIAASPFNTIMCYGISSGGMDKVRAYLDAMASRHLKLIYSIKDVYAGTKHYHEPVLGMRGEDAIVRGIVSAFKGHPALLAWYLNDELPLTLRDRLDARQQLLRQLDPNHPTWSVLYQVDEFFGYLNSADVLGSDPYPVAGKPVTLAADWTRKSAGVSGGNRPLWMVPQAFDWTNYPGVRTGQHRPPTLDEELVMSYLCLINGAHGLIYYSYSDLLRDRAGQDKRWADMLVVGAEMQRLIPALLSTAPPPGLELATKNTAVQSAMRADDAGNAYVLLANPGKKAAEVQVATPAGAKLELLHHGQTAPLAARGGHCLVSLEPLSAATLIVNHEKERQR